MRKKIILSILLFVQILIVNVLSFFPGFVENNYSNGIYPYIAKISRSFFGLFSFSIGDIIYGVVIFFILRWLWLRRKTWRREFKNNLLTVLSFFSVFYFLFNILWGVNYHREPLNEKMGIDKQYELEELVAFTKRLIEKTNQMHYNITKNDSVKVENPYTVRQVYDKAINGYDNLKQHFPAFSYETESIKSSLISTPLSYMGFGGYLNPFTNEAQVNEKLPLYNLPTTACHEMSHQIGYASESEANFIGYMASIYSDDVYFKYSGYSFALKYCIRNIEKIDEKQAKSLLPLINTGILRNFEESEQFNDRYSSFIEVIFKNFYDNFLKFNHQKDGLKTYSLFVGYLVNYYHEKDL